MSGQVKQYGTLSIPDYKIDAFLHDVRQVADQAGLLAIRHMRAYDEEFDLLCFPVDDGCSCIFDYSYFEDAVYDKVVIDVKTGEIHSSNLGFGQFGAAVRALAMLAESYSNPYYCCDNRFESKEMRWLSYVLDRPLTLPCHTTVWDVYERFVRDNGVNKTLSAMDFFNSYEGDETNIDEITTIVYVNDAITNDFIDKSINDEEPVDKSSYGYWVRSMARFLWLAKQNSEKSEKELLSRYVRLLHKVSEIRNDIKANKEVGPVKELFATVAPPITVKLIATIYGLDFWQLWRDHKESIGLTSSIFYDGSAEYKTEDEVNNLDPITTEEFFGVAPEERLYWWREDGDVVIDSKTQKWLEQMAEQHKAHIETMAEEFSAVDWHQRLVHLLGSHNGTIKMFETLYCDFLNAFHRREYRAWIEMLEVLANNDITECRRLISVLANRELRKKVFDV